MLLVLVLAALAVLTGMAAGGRLDRLAGLPPAGLWWLVVAALAQAAGSLLAETWALAYPVGLVTSAGCVAVFLIRNRGEPGVALLAAGFGLNALVVAVNGAMPVSAAALRRSGADPTAATGPRHEPLGDGTVLPWLGDVVPVALPGVGQAVSPGDVLIAAGAALMLFSGMRARGSEPEAAGHDPAQ